MQQLDTMQKINQKIDQPLIKMWLRPNCIAKLAIYAQACLGQIPLLLFHCAPRPQACHPLLQSHEAAAHLGGNMLQLGILRIMGVQPLVDYSVSTLHCTTQIELNLYSEPSFESQKVVGLQCQQPALCSTNRTKFVPDLSSVKEGGGKGDAGIEN
jgi:hypothetical protein